MTLLAWFDRIAGRLPGVQTTKQRRRVIDSFGFEFEHRPGARMFVRSSTVRGDHFAFGQLVQFGRQRAGGNGN